MKRVVIHQPDFAPYLGFFHRLLFCDLFIVLDDVQFVRKGGWHHRDKIKTPRGEQWLTLSVEKGRLATRIKEVLLSTRPAWIEDNLNLLRENYRKAPYFGLYFPLIHELYSRGFTKMIDLNMAFLDFFYDVFELQVKRRLSSDLDVDGSSNQKLINLIKAVGGSHYLSGVGARGYMNERLFDNEGIIVEWQDFHHPVYPQLHGPFAPNLSCIDLLFNCGPKSAEVLRSCLG